MLIKSKFSNIIIERNAVNHINNEIRGLNPSKVCIITNKTIAAFWLNKIIEVINSDIRIEKIVIDDGEKYKNLATAKLLWKKILEKDFTRKSLLISLGGGVVGDLTGFVASTFMRGIDFAQIPTTLLSQVDSSIGGKTGVNFYGKNMIGTFYQPKFVIVDTHFLETLPTLELLNGLAEIVKYAIILDESFFQFLKENVEKIKIKDEKVLQKIVERCIEMKIQVVEGDEREGDLRRILNFGHTFGHAIEKTTNYRTKHGFAISIGMMMACRVAEDLIGFNQTKDIEELLIKLGLPISTKLDIRKIVEGTLRDKKAWYGKIVVILPEKIGKVVIKEVEQEELLNILGR
jgi:3-dehydroquinate synthase